ncbi:universal stress protein [Streptomyces sp. NPDC048277]|uniref:universal stress protein n=1 Tax=Streptomyces sp. NPDC048277 TaxID=3155027 RepID=UPI0033C261A5
MLRTVTAGIDGSPESRAAAVGAPPTPFGQWGRAAREAKLRGLPLKIVHVLEPVPEPPAAQAPLVGPETVRDWTEKIPRESVEGLRLRHPGVDVTGEQWSGRPGEVLPEAAGDAEVLVLGSRGLGGLGGFLVGSVGLRVVAHAELPVVLVRAYEQAADEHEPDPAGVPSAATPFRPVVLGLDTDRPDAAPIEFAFDAARRRATSLHVVHGWFPPPYYAYGTPVDPALHEALARSESEALTEALRPWQQKFPDVEVVADSRYGSPAESLVEAARTASLVVVGRRARRGVLGPHIGHVTHAVLHHATAPVAVVPHG